MDSDDQQGLLVEDKTRNKNNNNMESSSSTTGFCYTEDVPSNNQIQNHLMNQIQQTFSRAVVHEPQIFNNLTPPNMEKAVVSSFDAVAGNGAAKVYSALASKAMSRHFRCLRDGILGQIQEANKVMGEKDTASVVAPGTMKGETPRLRLLDQTSRQQRAIQQMSVMESTHPWRPQRGLPERSVSVLRAWLFEHFLHPYPSDVDKHILARQTGLSRSQACPLKDRFLFSALVGFFLGGCARVGATPPTDSTNLEYAWKERSAVNRAKVPAIVTGVVVAVICVAVFLYRILKARTRDKVGQVPV